VFLHSVKGNFTAIWGDVEVTNVEVGSELGQPPLGARLQVDQPEILMLNLSSQEHKRSSSKQEGQASSPPSQRQGRQGMRCGVSRESFHRKRRADVGPRTQRRALLRLGISEASLSTA
jgi:hypothetical protein